jgi:hypothetical protein
MNQIYFHFSKNLHNKYCLKSVFDSWKEAELFIFGMLLIGYLLIEKSSLKCDRYLG